MDEQPSLRDVALAISALELQAADATVTPLIRRWSADAARQFRRLRRDMLVMQRQPCSGCSVQVTVKPHPLHADDCWAYSHVNLDFDLTEVGDPAKGWQVQGPGPVRVLFSARMPAEYSEDLAAEATRRDMTPADLIRAYVARGLDKDVRGGTRATECIHCDSQARPGLSTCGECSDSIEGSG